MYKLDMLIRTLRAGRPVEAARLARQFIRSRWFYEWRYVYALPASDLARVPDLVVPDLRIDCLSSPEDAKCLQQDLRDYPKLLPDDPHRLLAQGATFWVGRIDGHLASLGVSRTGSSAGGDYFFPLTSRCALLSHFATASAFRGRGLYPALLVHILRRLSATHESFVIDCHDWNLGSRRGIERAGFRHIGYGKVSRRGRASWFPLDPGRVALDKQPAPQPEAAHV